MEDNATAAVLARRGYPGRYLSLRTAGNFDQPYPGQGRRATFRPTRGRTCRA